MVVVMQREASEAEIETVAERVRSMGGEAFVSRGTVHTIIGLVGDTDRFGAVDWTQLPGVDHVIHVGKPYKMVSADLHPQPSMVSVGGTSDRPWHLHDHRRAVRGRERRAGADRDEGGQGRRRDGPAR